MRQFRMKKTDHAEWLLLLDDMLVNGMGAERSVYQEPIPGTFVPRMFQYRIQTQYGPLILKPETPWKLSASDRLRYDCTVFARFENDLPITHKYGHKWNHHYGPRERSELNNGVTDLAVRIARILPTQS